MPYSNQRLYELTPREVKRQIGIIAPLEQQHAAELFRAGTVERVLGSAAMSNKDALRDNINESTEITPIRRATKYLDPGGIKEQFIDAGLVTARDASSGEHMASLLGRLTDPTYVLALDRYEETQQGIRSSWYFAGLKLTEASRLALGLTGIYRPAPGVTVDDLVLIDRQLHEVGDFAVEHDLQIVDPLTLAVGPGLLMP